MKINKTCTGLFPIAVLLLPLALVSCKAADTQVQPQSSTEAGASATAKKAPAPKKAAEPKKPATTVTKLAKAQVQPDKAPAPAAGPAPAKVAAAPPPSPPPSPKKPKAAPKKAKSPYGPDDPRSSIYLSITGKMAGMGDPNKAVSEAYRIGMGEHPEALASAALPKDKFGLIDWIALVDQKIIDPKESLKPGAPVIPPFDMNVLIPAKGDFVNDVLFPHKAHTYWLKCENCHTGIFIMAKGKNNMTMQGITKGKWCGRCHGKVSFPLTDCARCHNSPKKGSGQAVTKK